MKQASNKAKRKRRDGVETLHLLYGNPENVQHNTNAPSADTVQRVLLAIDPGTRLGYAWTADRKVHPLQCGTVNLRPQRFEGGGMRFLRVRRWLNEVNPAEVVFEEVRGHKGTDAAQIYGGIVAVICAWCEEHSVLDCPRKRVPFRMLESDIVFERSIGPCASVTAKNKS